MNESGSNTNATSASSERDFGDSAGYGTGGSALDYREILGSESSGKRPNPLDAVMRNREQKRTRASKVAVAGALLAAVPLYLYVFRRGRRSRSKNKASALSAAVPPR